MADKAQNISSTSSNSERATDLFGKVVLVLGSEAFITDNYIAEVKSQVRQLPEQVEISQLAGESLTVTEFSEAVGGSLFSTKALVVVTDISRVAESVKEAIAEFVTAPYEDVALVLTHPGGQRGKALLDKVKKAKPVLVDANFNKKDTVSFVTGQFRKHQVRIDHEVSQLLVTSLGSDLRTLSSAVSQLVSDYSGEEITTAKVSQYFAGQAEVSVYRIADDLIAGRVSEALAQLRWALATGVAPVLVTNALASGFRVLAKYSDYSNSRLSQGDLASKIGAPPWKIRSLAAVNRNWSQPNLAKAIGLIAQADAGVKGGGENPGFTLEKLLIQLGQLANRAARR